MCIFAGIVSLAGCFSAASSDPYYYTSGAGYTTAGTVGMVGSSGGTPTTTLYAVEGSTKDKEVKSAEAPRIDPDRTQRIMIYNAVLYIIVEDKDVSIASIKKHAESAGGHMVSMDSGSIEVKVPAQKFSSIVEWICRLGEVTRKSIEGKDITEEMRDLKIRLNNAEKIRDRFLKLLETAKKTEEALKVEKELERVTENIELLKGRIKYLEENVALSKISVRLNKSVPDRYIIQEIPVPWVLQLGNPLRTGQTRPRHYGRRRRGIRFELPDTYIKYFERDYETWCMSPEENYIKLKMMDNYEGGSLEFWSKLIRRSLALKSAINIKEAKDLTLKTEMKAKVLTGSRTVGNRKLGYFITVAVNKKHVYTFEAWGPYESLIKDIPKLKEAVNTLRIKP